MPGKSKSKGTKKKKQKEKATRELEFKDDGQEYAQVLRMLGNCRCEVMCVDGVKRLAIIRGKLRNKYPRVQVSDIVLVGLRDCIGQDNKCDVIHRYNAEEARNLKAYDELPDADIAKLGGIETVLDDKSDEEDTPFDFDDI
jgi:translation initiation factor 1A